MKNNYLKDKNFCCQMLASNVEKSIDENGDIKYDDVDVILNQWSDGRIGIPVHDGGKSMIIINYCPWCGKKLKASS